MRTGEITVRVALAGWTAAALIVMTGAAQGSQTPSSTSPQTSQPPSTTTQSPTPAPSPTATPAPGSSFTGASGLIYVQIKPDKVADYESVVAKYKEALLKSEAPESKQMAAGMKLYKSMDPPPAASPNILYVWVVDPAVKDADYSANAMVKLLSQAFPAEAKALYDKLKDSLVGRTPLNLQMVTDFSK
jgi:hypothetical protein